MQRILGKLLKGLHAGESRLLWQRKSMLNVPQTIVLDSPSWTDHPMIPRRFAGPGVGDNLSPALHWSEIPTDTAELVLVLEDPDAPLPKPFVHLIAYGIIPSRTGIAEGQLTNTANGIAYGRNTFGGSGYQGPRALPGHGPHRYVWQIYALSQRIMFKQPPSLAQLETAMHGIILAKGRYDGFFEQP